MNNKNYKQEVRIALIGLVASLGLIKSENLADFISNVKNILEHSLGTTGNVNMIELILSVSVIICYLTYIALLGFSISALYKKKETILSSLAGAVTAFFLMYFLLLILMLNQVVLKK